MSTQQSSYSLSRILAAILAVALMISCSRQAEQKTSDTHAELIVAAAANLTDAFEELGRDFTSESGIKVTYSFGSTGDLTKQIENGAPFDVFAAADAEHPIELEKKNLIVPGTRSLYARGVLVLWIPSGSKIQIERIQDLARSEVKTIAIAKPELAPYGKATVETLQATGIWSQIEPKVVYAQNVSQTRQFASSGNAEAAFIPLALVKKGEGQVIAIDEKLHAPIEQELCLIKASNRREQAAKFRAYVLSEKGQALLKRYGYNRADGKQ